MASVSRIFCPFTSECRHGMQCYKTLGQKNCCPPYTILCDAANFQISRAQKKALNIVAAFLKTGEKPTEAENAGNSTVTTILNTTDDSYESAPSKFSDFRAGGNKKDSQEPKVLKSVSSKDSGIYLDDNGIKFTSRSGSAKRRRWQALQELMALRAKFKGVQYEEILKQYLDRRKRRLEKNKPKEIENYLEQARPIGDKFAHSLEIRLCRCAPRSDEFKATYEQEYELYYKYQIAIHKASPSSIRREDFDEFLVESSLVNDHDKEAEDAGAPQFGSYHQQYWLDGKKLIAVGVVDLVPGCLSSVYSFYDPDYSFLHLGTYTALCEIAFVRHLNRTYGLTVPAFSDFTRYYMGYYIHSTPKMRYKGAFSPSYLECPETNCWVPIKKCEPLLDRVKYTRLADFSEKRTLPSVSEDEIKIQLPFSVDLANKLGKGNFIVKEDTIITPLQGAESVLPERKLELTREFMSLISSAGTMCVSCSN
ncbi:hypothetical protein Aperf_G00000115204 [Anoplocephala perfoliata]